MLVNSKKVAGMEFLSHIENSLGNIVYKEKIRSTQRKEIIFWDMRLSGICDVCMGNAYQHSIYTIAE